MSLSFFRILLLAWAGLLYPPVQAQVSCTGKSLGLAPGKSVYKDIAYDGDVRTKFDLYYPAAIRANYPLVVLYHEGAFLYGDKSGYASTALDYQAWGVAVAVVNYRYANAGTKNPNLEADPEKGVLRSLRDGQRALQFIRCHAAALKIQPANIVLQGRSAGASMALWIGLQSEQAQPKSADPVARQSTRVRGIVASVPQASLDGSVWEKLVFKAYPYFSLDHMADFGAILYDLRRFDRYKFYNDARIISYRKRVNYLDQLSIDDPELWVESDEAVGPPSLHHPYHVLELKKRADAVRVKGSYATPKAPELKLRAKETVKAFVARKFQGR